MSAAPEPEPTRDAAVGAMEAALAELTLLEDTFFPAGAQHMAADFAAHAHRT